MSTMRGILATVLLASQTVAASWTDSRLPVTNGLIVWLDASAENAARRHYELSPVLNGAPLDCWHDCSPPRRDFLQPSAMSRPRLVALGSNALVRFDGADDFLARSASQSIATNLSVILLAAPRANPGGFRAFISANRLTRNDYTSGFNMDLGSRATTDFSSLNIEGPAFGGESNLMTGAFEMGAFHVIAFATEPNGSGTQLFVDGKAQANRERKAGSIALDQIFLGARCYSHEPEPPYARDCFNGDIAEVLIYDRVLSGSEQQAVANYLAIKQSALRSSLLPGQVLLASVSNPPPVQIFAPGFSVRELPVSLNNVNNVRYRRDGKLLAVGYDGNIWLLSDTDGDTLEDKAEPYWDKPTLRVPLGVAFTPPNYPRGDGVFLPCVGKVVLLLDTNQDDRADEEITIAQGWTGKDNRVDALGVALDPAGNVYFGLGIGLAFLNAYRLDKETGKAGYDIKNERGTILKVSPDFAHREIVATGIRFPVALAFNRHGDLFCTDQEGATWLPNGNPFDELLHIQPGRHYGFPPSHPKYLPNVIDEPSVFDYRPQHQSACGLNFNESVNGGPVFGPAWWTSDALVAGESRGKIWRTKLARTGAGYVARTELIANLSALTVDVCVSPRGDLLVATHGGNPDWGTGPAGKGRLFQIRYADTNAPQPVLAWSSNPAEFRIAFDRPLDTARLRNVAKQIQITRGKYASAGDRFETVRPGYQVVQNELAAARFKVPVNSALVSADQRTLMVRVPPQNLGANYAITLPESIVGDSRPPQNTLPRHSQLDLLATLDGVETSWQAKAGTATWSGWLPHVDFVAAREFTAASAEHERLWSLIQRPGMLTLKCQLDLWQMLHPAVQPGSELDYEPPQEHVTIAVSAANPFTVETGGEQRTATAESNRTFAVSFTSDPRAGEWLPVAINLPTGNGDPRLTVSWRTTDDPRPRAFQLRRFFLPWARPDSSSPEDAPRAVPELAGGDWQHGEQLFFSDEVACYKCHQINGKGARIGPDLSNLLHRDYASVLKDIVEPNAAINPDHLASQIELKTGDTVTAVILTESSSEIMFGDARGGTHAVRKTEIVSIKPSPLSLMPEGLLATLNQQQQKNLLTFLLLPRPPLGTTKNGSH